MVAYIMVIISSDMVHRIVFLLCWAVAKIKDDNRVQTLMLFGTDNIIRYKCNDSCHVGSM